MTESFKTTLDYLYSLQFFGIKLGMDNIAALLAAMKSPHLKYPVIHVAGTNGKGSVCAMMDRIFREAGYRVGLYTSPHIVRFSERIRINGAEISDHEIVAWTETHRVKLDNLHCTFFEATTAMAFDYFNRQNVDLAIIETGLGGRLDATNVVDPMISVITTIAFDHMAHLGNTIREITREKAGIIKNKKPCLVGKVTDESRQELESVAHGQSSAISFADDFSAVSNVKIAGNGSELDLSLDLNGKTYQFDKLMVNLSGRHQIDNAVLAVAATISQKTFVVGESAIRHGLNRVQWPGRLQKISEKPDIFADAAHNPAGLQAIREWFQQAGYGNAGKRILLIGMLADKDYEKSMSIIAPAFDEIILVRPNEPRAADPAKLLSIVHELKLNGRIGQSIREEVKNAGLLLKRDDVLIITGSFYVLSELEGIF